MILVYEYTQQEGDGKRHSNCFSQITLDTTQLTAALKFRRSRKIYTVPDAIIQDWVSIAESDRPGTAYNLYK